VILGVDAKPGTILPRWIHPPRPQIRQFALNPAKTVNLFFADYSVLFIPLRPLSSLDRLFPGFWFDLL
jgi:hypothetical protein